VSDDDHIMSHGILGKKLHAEKDQKRRIFVEILRPREGGLEQFGIYPRILADRSVSL
jgi:hypothetical protein